MIVFKRLDQAKGHQELILETVEDAKKEYDTAVRDGYIVSYNYTIIKNKDEITDNQGEMTAFKPISGG